MGRMLFPAQVFKVEFPYLHSFESIDKSLESFLLPLLFWKVQGLDVDAEGCTWHTQNIRGGKKEAGRNQEFGHLITGDIVPLIWRLSLTKGNKLSCPAPLKQYQLQHFIRKTWNNLLCSEQLISLEEDNPVSSSPSCLPPCCVSPFRRGQSRGEQLGRAFTSRASNCHQEAAPVYKEDLLLRQAPLEEKHLFKPLPFTLQCESPFCPFSHVHGGIR